jgi:flavin-dependent dehydrogenase
MGGLPGETEVLVVGGGPAGLAAAIAVRQRGFDVAVLDSARPPIDKACGEGLMPDAVEALAQLGVHPGFRHGFPFQGIRFVEGGTSAEACFPDRPGLGIRRRILHTLLVERAIDIGVALHWGAPVAGFDDGEAISDRCRIRSRWLVAADGQNSRIRRWAGLNRASSSAVRVGVRRHFRITPWTDHVEVYWRDDCQVYVTPVGPKEVCVAMVGRKHGLRFADLLSLFPQLRRRLEGAVPSSSVRGAVSVSSRLRRVASGKLALIGDASGSIDAITGEGLGLSFRQAIVLAEAFSRNDLRIYQRAHRRIGRTPHLISRLMLAFGSRADLRRRALAALSSNPRIFNRLLAVHVGAIKPASASLEFFGLAWRLLTSTASPASF